MKKHSIILLVLMSFINNLMAQEEFNSTLIQANNEIKVLSAEGDILLYETQLNDLQNFLFEQADYFYILKNLSKKTYIDYFKSSELTGNSYAFNPSLNLMKAAILNVKTDFDLLELKYSSSNVLKNTNYFEIKSHFTKACNLLDHHLDSNCNNLSNCSVIKDKILECNEHFNNSLNELITLLKL